MKINETKVKAILQRTLSLLNGVTPSGFSSNSFLSEAKGNIKTLLEIVEFEEETDVK